MQKTGSLKAGICWVVACLSLISNLPAQRVWSDVQLDRSSAYVGQPVEVRITVYTSTWFTRGLDLGNIKVNGAFTVYFRPVSQSFQYEGKTYAGVQQIYHVFPYQADDIVFPSLEIAVESPPEGDFKGVRQVIRSEEKPIRVMPVPPNLAGDPWLVATGLQVSQSWNGNLDQVRVGDVLERRISRTASGTVSELIPPITWDSLPGVSLYPARGSVQNNKTRTAISASRSETMRYLFEREGEVTLPEMVFTWYNPYRQQLYKRTLPEVPLQVKPNPDLGILASVRDSLADQQAAEAAPDEEEAEARTILGMSVKDFFIALGLILLGLYGLYLGSKGLILYFKKRRETFRQSEAYFFRRFKQAARKKEQGVAAKLLYRWIDELALDEPSVDHFVGRFGTAHLKKEWELGKQDLKRMVNRAFIKEWEGTRNNYTAGKSSAKEAGKEVWINPGRASSFPS